MKLILVIAIISISTVKSAAVCSAATLIRELKEDLRDNNKLDCLRKPLKPAKDKLESHDARKKRIEAAWDSDCAFEADYDWLSIAKTRYGISNGLVDKDGKAIDYAFGEQADMCELIRTMIVSELFPNVKLDTVEEASFEAIACPGPVNNEELQICAATSSSPAQKYTWYILLEPASLTFKSSNKVKPEWELKSADSSKLEGRKAITKS